MGDIQTRTSLGFILGSAFHSQFLEEREFESIEVDTAFGSHELHHFEAAEYSIYLSYRHGKPHRYLPNQINYRAQAAAFCNVDCQGLVVTSSVGVMNTDLPIYEPLVVTDLLMPENRLPDGSACTMFSEPIPEHGHLVLEEGLFSEALNEQITSSVEEVNGNPPPEVVFAYVGGPRTKTNAENHYWANHGADVNSMTLGPEVVLANELEIPTAGLVVGHKYSSPDTENPDEENVTRSLEESRGIFRDSIERLVDELEPVQFQNHLYRFE